MDQLLNFSNKYFDQFVCNYTYIKFCPMFSIVFRYIRILELKVIYIASLDNLFVTLVTETKPFEFTDNTRK